MKKKLYVVNYINMKKENGKKEGRSRRSTTKTIATTTAMTSTIITTTISYFHRANGGKTFSQSDVIFPIYYQKGI